MDIPDRLPFELLERVNGGPPPVSAEHHLEPVTLVMASKKTGTARPFTRLDPIDLTLYQALVDRLAPDIEAALPGRQTVFAYRQSLEPTDHAFAGSPSRAVYESAIQELFSDAIEHAWAPHDTLEFALTTDIGGFFLQVEIDELERLLYSISNQTNVVRDLCELLRAWQGLGVRGLPQGIRASSALGNLYLLPIDRLLLERGITYLRWMDDIVVATTTFHDARRVQDEIEQALYIVGLTLNAAKTSIVRAQRAVDQSVTAREALERAKRARRAAFIREVVGAGETDDYLLEAHDDDLEEPEDIDLEAVVATFDPLLDALDDDHLPTRFRPLCREILRDLASVERAHRLHMLPRLVERAPDLTKDVASYLAATVNSDLAGTVSVLAQLVNKHRFSREHERLALCHGVLNLPVSSVPAIEPALSDWALEDPHPLVRARALLAWGVQSDQANFSVADAFWEEAAGPWRIYALAAIQEKDATMRNERYARWGSDGRYLGAVATVLKHSPIRRTRL